ncbi:MAG: 4-(cytidine 5'-diphospho)-2-C-methyl-D-erythritol kinase, partial [Clostridia bacterium]|nr:4-(cytidine 5'-diphospho)-2-C-methyl-D-erythritol kinase [Clostridia bacterium]
MQSVVVSTAAKINWTLDIVGTREDGYHELDMLMQRITLYDTVQITRTGEGIVLSSGLPWLPSDERNLAYKSAALFFRKTGAAGGCSVKIVNYI